MLVKRIEELNRHISDLKGKIGSKSQKEEKIKYNFLEKDQEIRFLKNFVSNLKADNNGKILIFIIIFSIIVKDSKYKTLKGKLSKLTEDNKNLRNSINSMEYKNQLYNIISEDEEVENGKNSTKYYRSGNDDNINLSKLHLVFI